MTNPKASFQCISIHSMKISYLKLGWHRYQPGSRTESELDTFDPSLHIFFPSFQLPPFFLFLLSHPAHLLSIFLNEIEHPVPFLDDGLVIETLISSSSVV